MEQQEDIAGAAPLLPSASAARAAAMNSGCVGGGRADGTGRAVAPPPGPTLDLPLVLLCVQAYCDGLVKPVWTQALLQYLISNLSVSHQQFCKLFDKINRKWNLDFFTSNNAFVHIIFLCCVK